MFNFITQLLVSLTIVSVTVYCQLCGDPQKTVKQAFIDSGLVDDLNLKLPSDGFDLIEVTYFTRAISRDSVSCGTKLKYNQTDQEPFIKYPTKPNTLYTFMMLDPDVPSRSAPIFRSVIFWFVVNVQGDDLESGIALFNYHAPGPVPHRYVFMVFEQSQPIDVSGPFFVFPRDRFNVADWAERNKATGPVSGNYFLGQATP